MQKYFGNPLIGKFMNNVLYNVYIPTCNTVNQGDFIIKGFDYVYETNLIKCTKTGFLGGRYKQDVEYGLVYGKNRLFNRYVDLTKLNIFANTFTSEYVPTGDTPFAQLDLVTKRITYYYGLYKFDGTEEYTENIDGNILTMTHRGDTVRSNYSGLDDFKTLCNKLTKTAENVLYSYATITLFENDDLIHINNYKKIAGVSSIDTFRQWTVNQHVYYSYPLEYPVISEVLSDEVVKTLIDGLDDDIQTFVYNEPLYNMIYNDNRVRINFVTTKNTTEERSFIVVNNGIMYTTHSDGSVDISGTATADSYLTINLNFNSEQFEGYLFSGFDATQQEVVKVRITNVSLDYTYQEIHFNNEPIQNNGTSVAISLFVSEGITIENYTFYPMIRDSSVTSSEYVPYEDAKYMISKLSESIVDTAKYTVISSYEWGKIYNKYTENFISTSDYWDSEVHKYLGKFLRALRDVKGIDLMPYYNMYTGEYLANFKIDGEGLQDYYNNTYKILKVPIKFNKTYTIAIDCPSEVYMCPAFFRGNMPIIFKTGSTGESVNMTDRFNSFGSYIRNFSSMSFRSPVTYKVDNTSMTTTYGDPDCAYFQQYERDLCLLIQLPAINTSSVVILEGDYTNTNSKQVINNAEAWQLHDVELNRVFCSNLSLLQFSTHVNYVYSDRLIEYMLWNVICTHDKIYNNFEYIQQLAPNLDPSNYTLGAWNNYMRSQIYTFSTSASKSKRLDLNGFVDKDTENLLMKQLFR